MNFLQKLDKAINKNNSLLCVGLDPQIDKLPEQFKNEKYPLFAFNKYIIEQTHEFVSCFKPNAAFYEAHGSHGIVQLKLTFDLLKGSYGHIPTILDAKRADIGNTNNGYVSFIFDYLQADAVTVHPYLGQEAIQPFLDCKDKGIIILCRTSNSGACEFQDLQIDGEPLYERIAKNVKEKWNTNDNCLLVVGATYPQELKTLRTQMGEMTFLIPGIGAQGGKVADIMNAGLNSKKRGMIISASRGVIYAKDPRAEAEKLQKEINSFR